MVDLRTACHLSADAGKHLTAKCMGHSVSIPLVCVVHPFVEQGSDVERDAKRGEVLGDKTSH